MRPQLSGGAEGRWAGLYRQSLNESTTMSLSLSLGSSPEMAGAAFASAAGSAGGDEDADDADAAGGGGGGGGGASLAPVSRILAFNADVSVIASKQKPRRIAVGGSDGRQYAFLLKGREDLRQDERVMQLFGLVNNLLSAESLTAGRGLRIRRYAVTPLSHDAGVVGWLPSCDTLHQLIRQHRESRNVAVDIERRVMQRACPRSELLPAIHQVAVFEAALAATNGRDLERVLWLRAVSPQEWLRRRTALSRSLAVMSVVGYVLGLGDRHPSNLMMDRVTGRVVHIDFGDCFEVATTREKFPEKVPFRLTRMLSNAMEVAGIEGHFRSTAERTMTVVRSHRDSLMAMLEAFVHDPLINWRLVSGAADDARTDEEEAEAEARAAASTSGAARVLLAAQAANRRGASLAGTFRGVSASSSRSLVRSAHAAAAAAARRDRVSGGTGADADDPDRGGGDAAGREALNARALAVVLRVRAKLSGRDFAATGSLSPEDQVSRLVEQATSHENLAVLYMGWCPWW